MKAIATPESVRQAKELLERQGKEVTVVAIRQEIGGGSHTTINRILQSLRGVLLVPADVANHLLTETRRQRATIEEMRDDREPLVIEDDCNITVDADRSMRVDRGSDFLAMVCERWMTVVAGTNAPVRTGYVLRLVTHCQWHATVLLGAEDPRHG